MLFHAAHTSLYVCTAQLYLGRTPLAHKAAHLDFPDIIELRVFLLPGQLRRTAEGQQKYSRCNCIQSTYHILSASRHSMCPFPAELVGLLRRQHPFSAVGSTLHDDCPRQQAVWVTEMQMQHSLSHRDYVCLMKSLRTYINFIKPLCLCVLCCVCRFAVCVYMSMWESVQCVHRSQRACLSCHNLCWPC